MHSVSVRVPATSANLGPGFDCLGLALSLYNDVRMTAVGDFLDLDGSQDLHEIIEAEVSVIGTNAATIPLNKNNLTFDAAVKVFNLAGRAPSHLIIEIESRIPVASGLGSSSSAIVAGVVAANELVDAGLSPRDMVQLAAEMEGHLDNVAPALLGGLVLGVRHILADGRMRVHVEQIPIPSLKAVFILPEVQLLTVDSRRLLPESVDRQDAIDNAAQLGLLIQALTTGNHTALSLAMQDKLHQPYRLPLIPCAEEAMAAGYHAGANGIALSGAGPGLLALALGGHEDIAKAMSDAFAGCGVASRKWIVDAVEDGASVTAVG